MFKTFFCTILLLCLCPRLIYGQDANITFQSDTTANITLYGEIDNAINKTNPIDTIQLTPNSPISYPISIKDFSYLYIQYSSGVNRKLLLLPGNRMTISYSDNKVQIRGDNQDGQLLLNKYFSAGLSIYIDKYLDEWRRYTNNDIEYKALIDAMQKDTILLHEHFNQIATLVREQKVSQNFADIVKENFCLFKQAGSVI